MILIGRYYSPFVRRVGATLQHYGFEYEHRAIRASGTDQDEIRSHGNPLGRVPVLVKDDGGALADSAVILDYLDDLAGDSKRLTPDSGAERYDFMSLLAIANGAAEKAIAVFSEHHRPEDKQHAAAIEGNTRQAKDGLEYLDARIKGPWFAGDQVSQLDISLVCYWEFMRAGAKTVFEACDCPALDALAQRARELPIFKNTPLDA